MAAIGGTLHRYSQALDTNKLADLEALFVPGAFFIAADQVARGFEAIKNLITDYSSKLCSTVHHFHIDRTFDYDPSGKNTTLVISHFEVIETCNGHISTYGAEAHDYLELNTRTGVRVRRFSGRWMSGGLF